MICYKCQSELKNKGLVRGLTICKVYDCDNYIGWHMEVCSGCSSKYSICEGCRAQIVIE